MAGKDLDFDELDKAVTNLMGTVKTDDEPKQTVLHINETLKNDEKPQYDNIKEAAQRIGDETIVQPTETLQVLGEAESQSHPKTEENQPVEISATPPVVEEPPLAEPATPVKKTSRVGRFMDVIHPSSDMTTASVGVSPVAKAPEPASVETPQPPVVPAIVVPEREVPEEVDQKTTSEQSPDELLNEPSVAEPLSSPFLPDAKVEKRPLGGAAVGDSASEGLPIGGEVAKSDDQDTQLTPAEATTELPEELTSDLLAIETENDTEDTVNTDGNGEGAIDDARRDIESTEDIPQPTIAAQMLKERYADKQSSEQETDEEQEPSTADDTKPIYDTEHYHTSVAHPSKSHASVLWIVLIIVIVVICGAGAAAFYMLTSQ